MKYVLIFAITLGIVATILVSFYLFFGYLRNTIYFKISEDYEKEETNLYKFLIKVFICFIMFGVCGYIFYTGFKWLFDIAFIYLY